MTLLCLFLLSFKTRQLNLWLLFLSFFLLNNFSGVKQASSWSLESALKFKNLFGYGDLWDGSLAYGPNQTSEVSVGVFVPRLKGLLTPVVARAFMHSQDWQEYSSYKERSTGMSLGFFSTKHHDFVYNLGWRTITDPSQMSSKSIRRQIGHGLLSSLKYTFKIDQRNSPVRPTNGYAFLSATQLGGLAPDHRSLRFLRQVWLISFMYLHSSVALQLKYCKQNMIFSHTIIATMPILMMIIHFELKWWNYLV